MQLASDPSSMRIYTVEECERLDAPVAGVPVIPWSIQVLNPRNTRNGIERVLASIPQSLTRRLEMGYFDGVIQHSGCGNAYQQMEEITFEVVMKRMLH